MHGLKHIQVNQVKLSMPSNRAVTATGQGGQVERRQASGRPHAVSEGRGAGTDHDRAAHAVVPGSLPPLQDL